MSNTLPQKFKVKTSQQRQRNKFSLHHNHLTTTDFFKLQPVVCRKVEPHDEMNIDCTSFVRLFPMPFPVFGRIRYYNRCFFVPYRQIMEGFNEFITDTNYNTSAGFVKILSAPYFTNKDVCDAFMSSTVDYPSGETPLIDAIPDVYYWREVIIDSQKQYLLVNHIGQPVYYTGQVSPIMFVQYEDGTIQVRNANLSPLPLVSASGSYVSTVESDDSVKYTITDSYQGETYEFVVPSYQQSKYFGSWVPTKDPTISSTQYDKVKFDFVFYGGGTDVFYYRFTNRGRHFYTVLCSLGYRVDFSSADGSFTETKKLSAGKLLAYLKVYLDWYHPSSYSEDNPLRMNFRGVASSGHHITYEHLKEIAYGLDFVSYERDYFTAAWQNPSGPNINLSDVTINDFNVQNDRTGSGSFIDERSRVLNYGDGLKGSINGTPVLCGLKNNRSNGALIGDPTPYNISYYMIEQLRALTNVSRRAQLTGNRAVDRYLAQYGIKLDDDRVNRCYYIGGYHYDADIMDIMSTADTTQAALGDYAGKGIAYSDAHRSFHFESGQEHGFIIVVSSVVPSVGYVQGVDAENLQLSRFQFFTGDFDNLGTQAQQNQELFSDYGMPSPNGVIYPKIRSADGVRGFVPRYIEEKIGRDFLTGDFNIPSRREGMDAFHLFRLINNPDIPSINKGFLLGEQKQYDRIFNNIDSDYDHMYVEHHVLIDAYRNMKSVNEVYDFEHSDGKEMEVDANGTQLS